MVSLLRDITRQVSSLDRDSLVHQGGEVGKVIRGQRDQQIRSESITELLLFVCISGDVSFSVAGQVEEVPLILLDSPVALSEVAKFSLLAIHYSLRDVTCAECSLEISPGDHSSFCQ